MWIEKDVGWLDVAMQNRVIVSVIESARDIGDETNDPRQIRRYTSGGERGEVATFDVVHG